MRTIPQQESLTVEFKSDQNRLPDAAIVAAIVCLANTEGGTLYLGVEDNGTITGLHPKHHSITQLSAFIANRTNPPIIVRASLLQEDEHTVAAIEVPKSPASSPPPMASSSAAACASRRHPPVRPVLSPRIT